MWLSHGPCYLTYLPSYYICSIRARQLPQLPQLQPQAARSFKGRDNGLVRLLADLGAEEEGGGGAQGGGRPLLSLDGFRRGLARLPRDVWTGDEGSMVGELVRNDAFTLALFQRCDADEDGLLSQADMQVLIQNIRNTK